LDSASNVTSQSEKQPEKHRFPISFTLAGIVILSKREWLNVSRPISSNCDPASSITSQSEKQPEKHAFSMTFTLDGIVTVFVPVLLKSLVLNISGLGFGPNTTS
jgi:hypothetical protein